MSGRIGVGSLIMATFGRISSGDEQVIQVAPAVPSQAFCDPIHNHRLRRDDLFRVSDHLFQGRYKAQVIDADTPGCLRAVCP